MDSQIHNSSEKRRNRSKNPIRNGIRRQKQQKRTSPKSPSSNNGRKAKLFLGRFNDGLVLLDTIRKHVILQNPAGQSRRHRSNDAADQETHKLRP